MISIDVESFVNHALHRDALDTVSIKWREVPVTELQQVSFYNSNWESTNHLEKARAAGLDSVLTLQQAAVDLEGKLSIERRWEPGSNDWNYWEDYISQREYYRAIDVLEGLVVARLFELTKMNQSETGKCSVSWHVRTPVDCTKATSCVPKLHMLSRLVQGPFAWPSNGIMMWQLAYPHLALSWMQKLS